MAESESGTRPAGADAGVFLGTFALIFLAMGALFAANLFLAGLERSERRSEARHFYEEGARLAGDGRRSEAVDRFQSAIAAERRNPVYQRALAAAMLETGKPAEARALAEARLEQDPADAAASLLVGRALVREGKPREAVSYYHRAIYGHWDENPTENRMRSRFELVELLARLNSRRELLAELLPLQDQAPGDLATRRRIASLFLEAGAPTRALEIGRELLRKHGRDAATYVILGEAQLARSNYRSALANLTAATELAPRDSTIAGRLALVRRVIELDPTQRGLAAEERYRRSTALLELTLQSTVSCLASDTVLAHRAVADSARAALAHRRPGNRHEAVESNLELAERLWELRVDRCPAEPSAEEEPVALVLERVAQ